MCHVPTSPQFRLASAQNTNIRTEQVSFQPCVDSKTRHHPRSLALAQDKKWGTFLSPRLSHCLPRFLSLCLSDDGTDLATIMRQPHALF